MNSKTAIFGAACTVALSAMADESTNSFSARIATWRGDAKGAVSLYYDDGTESSFSIVRPALVERGLSGTFYICAGWFKGEDDPSFARWADAFKQPGLVPGNHTWSHCGAANVDALVEEVSKNDAALRKLAGFGPEELMTFAIPGGVQWNVTDEELTAVLSKYNEVLRHDFEPNVGGPLGGNPNFKMQTFEATIEGLDRAENEGRWESFLFHGVGGDWIRFPASIHERFLDELAARVAQRKLWCAPAAEVQKYVDELDGAVVSAVEVPEGWEAAFRLVVPRADATRNAPLTVVVDVPEDWDVAALRIAPDAGDAVELKKATPGGKVAVDVPASANGVSLFVRKAN